ncbi:MAG: DUF559 domain-containing protein [Flexistipes sinusarabici]|uniref:DUF559 domain-containing protein n=1 Tax=Flexistipes sinusarabici TaxID=2352 RepID=A0A5D0MKK8_FLESI|nr:zinc-ribbon domain-containing protein [Flexistipes sinusarabici]TYB32445.1 MAG: DUF559 domain-containing protein [Flexistipes sinusarabici]
MRRWPLLSENKLLVGLFGDKNIKSASSYTQMSQQEVWWKCPYDKKHPEYLKRIDHMVNKNKHKCPICTNSLPVNIRDDLMKQWSINNDLNPGKIKLTSHKNALWICEKHGEYSQEIRKKALRGDNCPSCSKFASNNHNLLAKYPSIAHELNESKRGIKASKLTPYSNKKLLWNCSRCGTEFKTTVNHRTSTYRKSKGTHAACPGCSGRKPTPKNNLKIKAPYLIPFWNDSRQMDKFLIHSSDKVNWKCPACNCHFKKQIKLVYKAKLTPCPNCSNAGLSTLQIRLFVELSEIFKKVDNRAIIQRYESDLLVNDCKLSIEVDGFYYHEDKYDYDLQKNKIINSNGFIAINLREEGLKQITIHDIRYSESEKHFSILHNLLKKISIFTNKDLSKYVHTYSSGKYLNDKRYYDMLHKIEPLVKNSLSDNFRDVEKRWSKLNEVSPKHVSAGSGMNVYLKCPIGLHNDYITKAYSIKNTWQSKYGGCPECAGRGKCPTEESVSATHPLISDSVIRIGFKENFKDRTIHNTSHRNNISAEFRCLNCGRKHTSTMRNKCLYNKTLGCSICYRNAPLNPYFKNIEKY